MRRAVNILFTILVSVGLILLGIFVFSASYARLWETQQEFGRSIGYYFCEVFGIPHNIIPTVIDGSQASGNITVPLPDDFSDFKANAVTYFGLLFSKSNFYGWISHIAGVMTEVLKIGVVVLPCFIGLWFYIKPFMVSTTQSTAKTPFLYGYLSSFPALPISL